MITNEKYRALIACLAEPGKILLALSGGTDSSFLLAAALEAAPGRLKAVTVRTPYMISEEIEEAKKLCAQYGVEHEIIEMPVIEEIRNNPEDRCYICKRAMFERIIETAESAGYEFVADGTNYDDADDYRPGLRALRELEVRSPLMECGFTKEEIRRLSREMGLVSWDRPSSACLLSRIPYGTELREEDFERIERAEKLLSSLKFRGARVRAHGSLARIEVSRNEMSRLFDEETAGAVISGLKQLGFRFVTMDMQGYRTGSLNEEISGIQPGAMPGKTRGENEQG
jgi:uncharacterized protein